MADQDSNFKQKLDELRQIRDELRVKAHLARLEADDAWEGLEARWEDLEAKAKQIGRESSETLEEVQAAADLLASELGEAYQEIKRRLLS